MSAYVPWSFEIQAWQFTQDDAWEPAWVRERVLSRSPGKMILNRSNEPVWIRFGDFVILTPKERITVLEAEAFDHMFKLSNDPIQNYLNKRALEDAQPEN